MFSRLLSVRTRFKVLALFRGLGVFALISVAELHLAGLTMYWLPSLLAFPLQILLPLALVQLYTLWTHTVLTYPSGKSLWQRMPPFKATLRATGPALAVLLAAKALFRFTLVTGDQMDAFRRTPEFSTQYLGPRILAWVGVEVVALMPAHMVLTRIQASLLPADERAVVSIDEALWGDGDGGESEAVGMKEAWQTFGWGAWRRLAVLYMQVFGVVVGGTVVLAVDFVLYIVLATA